MSAGISRRTILLKMVSLMLDSLDPAARWPSSVQYLATAERMRQRAAVDVFQFAAQRHAVGQPGRAHATGTRQLREVVRGRVTFHGGIGGDDHLLDLALAQAPGQFRQPQFFRPEPVQRRQPAHQHEVLATITGGLLDRRQFGRRLDHAQHLSITTGTGAQRAQRLLAEIAATLAVADLLHRLRHHPRKPRPALALALKQMKRHPLRTLATHAGQAAQRLDQFGKKWGAVHGPLAANGESGMESRESTARWLPRLVSRFPISDFRLKTAS